MIDCSKTENYFAEKLRMTKRTRKGLCKIDCSVCPLCSENNGTSGLVSCTTLEMLNPEKAIEIVQKWSDAHPRSDAHPQKTFLTEFLKNYPNAPLDDDGAPKGVCPHTLGLTDIDDCDDNCVKCWNQPIEDGKK
ncbi:hypothetical protein DXD93_03455 [Ruminococcus bromii]|nr:hypothetical protein [Ruminococcus bromii]RGI72001.1 hypothetical protein DXD93_03455 [Ruminococcus bromii]